MKTRARTLNLDMCYVVAGIEQRCLLSISNIISAIPKADALRTDTSHVLDFRFLMYQGIMMLIICLGFKV